MKYRTAPVPSKKMPTGIPYIVSNEAAERFSFYGMKGILPIFMANYLHLMGQTVGVGMSETAAVEKVHWFNSAVYLTPFIGAIISDAFLGKYRTIILLSLVYCAGHAALAFMGTVGDPGVWLLSGLILIALGAGGIKPCVSAHVGDQFGKTNSHLIPKAFNFFYFSINLGAFISGLLTPWLLEWYGPHWAFGVPGILMALATLAFWMGRKRFIHVPARGLAYFKDLVSSRGLVTILKLILIYAFVAVFWALFDQTGSSWIFQAENMDRHWMGIHWLSSQIQAANAICILLFIPLCTFVLYPAIDKVFKLTPLRKVSIGLFIMVIGFGMVAVVQEWIDDGEVVSVGWQVFAIALVTLAEVMVSIVTLEFSYTQAPNSMKSIIMALYLCSVSVGNMIAASVNSYIQIENPLKDFALVKHVEEAVEDGEKTVRLDGDIATFAGHDGEFYEGEDGTGDDYRILFKPSGERRAIHYPSRFELERAAKLIEKSAYEGGEIKLPTTEEGQKLLAREADQWGNPIQYRLLSWKKFRVSSMGADAQPQTRWDVGIVVSIADAEKKLDKEEGKRKKTWLERYKEQRGIDQEKDDGELPIEFEDTHPVEAKMFARKPFTGGQVTMEGASYFWFFTQLMLAAASLFVVVVLFYKPRTYLQDEEPLGPEDEAEEDLGARGVMS